MVFGWGCVLCSMVIMVCMCMIVLICILCWIVCDLLMENLMIYYYENIFVIFGICLEVIKMVLFVYVLWVCEGVCCGVCVMV